MIAMALSCDPKLLIADEPTTALDVTIQAQIVDLVRRLQTQLGMAVMWITHDLGVVAELAKKINVMYAGYIIERGDVRSIYKRTRHVVCSDHCLAWMRCRAQSWCLSRAYRRI